MSTEAIRTTTSGTAAASASGSATGSARGNQPLDLLGFLGALDEATAAAPLLEGDASTPAPADAALPESAADTATAQAGTDPAAWMAWLRQVPDVLPPAGGQPGGAAESAAATVPTTPLAEPVAAADQGLSPQGLPATAVRGTAPAADAAEAARSFFGQMQAVLHKAQAAGHARSAAADAAGQTVAVPAAASLLPPAPAAALQGASAQPALPGMENAAAVALPAATAGGESPRSASGRSGGDTRGNDGQPGQAMAQAMGGDAAVPATEAATAAGAPARFEDALQQVWNDGVVQNAELTVPGSDGNALSVSVSLNGLEAQVAFRSDQAEARAALAASVGELQQMLAAEGLSLGGVSVGTAPQQQNRDGQAPSDGDRRAARTVGAREPAATASTPARRGAAGGLDLYA